MIPSYPNANICSHAPQFSPQSQAHAQPPAAPDLRSDGPIDVVPRIAGRNGPLLITEAWLEKNMPKSRLGQEAIGRALLAFKGKIGVDDIRDHQPYSGGGLTLRGSGDLVTYRFTKNGHEDLPPGAIASIIVSNRKGGLLAVMGGWTPDNAYCSLVMDSADFASSSFSASEMSAPRLSVHTQRQPGFSKFVLNADVSHCRMRGNHPVSKRPSLFPSKFTSNGSNLSVGPCEADRRQAWWDDRSRRFLGTQGGWMPPNPRAGVVALRWPAESAVERIFESVLPKWVDYITDRGLIPCKDGLVINPIWLGRQGASLSTMGKRIITHAIRILQSPCIPGNHRLSPHTRSGEIALHDGGEIRYGYAGKLEMHCNSWCASSADEDAVSPASRIVVFLSVKIPGMKVVEVTSATPRNGDLDMSYAEHAQRLRAPHLSQISLAFPKPAKALLQAAPLTSPPSMGVHHEYNHRFGALVDFYRTMQERNAEALISESASTPVLSDWERRQVANVIDEPSHVQSNGSDAGSSRHRETQAEVEAYLREVISTVNRRRDSVNHCALEPKLRRESCVAQAEETIEFRMERPPIYPIPPGVRVYKTYLPRFPR